MSEPSMPRADQTLSDSQIHQLVPGANGTAPRPTVPHETVPPTRWKDESESLQSTRAPETNSIGRSSDMPLGANYLGRFEVHGEIGRGGMGVVLHGRDPHLGRALALKVLHSDHHGNTEARRRFHEEAQIGGQLQHPGLVPVYELGTDGNDCPFFAMKLVAGRTLAALLKERKARGDDQTRFLTIFEQVCHAVGYAHARGVIHRDLKPANVMVGAFGEVQVMDWGLAKVRSTRRARSRATWSRAQGLCWGRPRTCLRSRRAGRRTGSTHGPTSSGLARSCARS
jgi:serine/threonine protein kinase